MRRMVLMVAGVLLALAVASPMALAQVGQREKASGETAELAATWWQWSLSKPVEDNPLIGGDPTTARNSATVSL